MVFSGAVFLFIFLPIVMLGYHLFRGNARNYWLLAASLFFYAWNRPSFIWILFGSIAVNYLGALGMERTRSHAVRKLLLVTAVLLNLALLFYFKYFNFTVSVLEKITKYDFQFTEVILPIGISFFTFQGLSYLVDVYRADVPAQRNLLKYAMYISLFPQLVAGPIVRYRDIAAEIDHRSATREDLVYGVRRFILGLFKKIMIADTLAVTVNFIFGSEPNTNSVMIAWLGILLYALQIFFDFSGYSDMAIGMGRIFGFHFLENFNYPYISRSVVEFWKRWHISLTNWFREYVYFPLGGNRVSRLKWVRNILVVWLLTGIWHGAGWNFLLWGLYYALWMLAERLFLGRWLEKLPDIFRHIYAMAVVLVGWALFAVEDMGRLGRYLGACFGAGPLIDAAALYQLRTYLPLLVILALASTPLGRCLWSRLGERARGVLTPVLVLACLVLCTASLVDASYNPFLYFRF